MEFVDKKGRTGVRNHPLIITKRQITLWKHSPDLGYWKKKLMPDVSTLEVIEASACAA
jgi:hypothetical protein